MVSAHEKEPKWQQGQLGWGKDGSSKVTLCISSKSNAGAHQHRCSLRGQNVQGLPQGIAPSPPKPPAAWLPADLSLRIINSRFSAQKLDWWWWGAGLLKVKAVGLGTVLGTSEGQNTPGHISC